MKDYTVYAVERLMEDLGISPKETFRLYRKGGEFIGNARIMETNGRYSLVVNEIYEDNYLWPLLQGKLGIETLSEASPKKKGRIRGFELIASRPGAKLPERATKNSAGYDFFACEDVKILPHQIKVAWTGVKAYMPPNEVLKVYNRSSNAAKKGLMLSNGVGIIDSDYYNNPDNEGDIGFAFYNFTSEIVTIKKGDKLGQAIFEAFNTADNDIHGGKRTGGFGSTGK